MTRRDATTAGGPRTYADPCGIARALDLVGERWALLVVRELLLGPKRFTQLRRGLHGASANVLAQRLRELEDAGVVRRYRLGPPAGVVVYALTERGAALEPVLLALGRWGSSAPMTSDADLGADALMIALKTRFDPSGARIGPTNAGFDSANAAATQATYAVQLGDDHFRIALLQDRLEVARGSEPGATATITADSATFRSVIFGRESPDAAGQAGRLTIAGDHESFKRLIALFATPGQVQSAHDSARPRPIASSQVESFS